MFDIQLPSSVFYIGIQLTALAIHASRWTWVVLTVQQDRRNRFKFA